MESTITTNKWKFILRGRPGWACLLKFIGDRRFEIYAAIKAVISIMKYPIARFNIRFWLTSALRASGEISNGDIDGVPSYSYFIIF